MFELKLTYKFCAAHRLENLQEGHKCRRLHGHNYEVALFVRDEFLTGAGFVVDAGEVDELMEGVGSELDHNSLNEVLEQPSSERLAEWLFWRLVGMSEELESKLFAVEVRETDKISARFEVAVSQQ